MPYDVVPTLEQRRLSTGLLGIDLNLFMSKK